MKLNRIVISLALSGTLALAQQNVQIVGGGNYALRSPSSAQFGDANKYPRWDAAQTWTGTQTFNGALTLGSTVSHGAASADTFLSGASATFASGSTLTVNGILAGTHAQPIGTADSPTFVNLTITNPLPGASGGTGAANTGKTITLAGNLATSGAFGLTLTLTGTTNVTLPATGTLATLAGTETLTNKTLTSPTLTTPILGSASATSLALTGTAGAGFTSYPSQSSAPAAPASGFVEYADGSGRRAWRRASDGFTRTWDATLTANRTYALPDADGTVITNTNPSGTTIANVDSLTASATTNLTLAGGSSGANLVVGQGANANITLTPTGTGYVDLNRPLVRVPTGTRLTTNTADSTSYTLYLATGGTVLNTPAATPLAFAIGDSEKARLSAGFNLLLGTATDNSNGRLQLATHTTAAGGIGFGSDWALYRTGAQQINLLNAQNALTNLQIQNTTVGTAAVASVGAQADSYGVFLQAFSSGYTTALSAVQNSNRLFGNSAAGLSIVSQNNWLRLWAGNPERELLRLYHTGTLGSEFLAGTTVKISDTTASTSPVTGALQVAGGVGIAGALNLGSNLFLPNTNQMNWANTSGTQRPILQFFPTIIFTSLILTARSLSVPEQAPLHERHLATPRLY